MRQGTTPLRSAKSPQVEQVVAEALAFLEAAGIPVETLTAHRKTRTAMAFLAVGNVRSSADWPALKDANSRRSIKTRDIIAFINDAFGEAISSGSYDDIRRKDLLLPVAADIIVQTKTGAARNDSTRGYAIAPEFAIAARLIPNGDWRGALAELMANSTTLRELLNAERRLNLLPVTLPDGATLELSPGEHNRLQKAVLEEFLPRYGFGAEVLYVGDTAAKYLVRDTERLNALRFFELAHGELPDIVAYSAERNWLYLIEAVHASGPITPMRKLTLEQLTANCTAAIIYVTAFLDRAAYKRYASEIAWETEVWIADAPDHLIHLDGDKFLGPYRT